MKDTGMARKVDDLGRIVLPVELRRLHGIGTGDALEISVDGDAIVLRKLHDGCTFCGDGDSLTRYRERWICGRCLRELARMPAGHELGDGGSAGGGPPPEAAGAPQAPAAPGDQPPFVSRTPIS